MSRSEVARWMMLHVKEHDEPFKLANQAASIFNLHEYSDFGCDAIPQWVIDLAEKVWLG